MRALVALAVLALPAWAGHARAQPAAETTAQAPVDPSTIEVEQLKRQTELERISASIRLSEERQAALAAEIAEIAKDRASLNDDLIATAARMGPLEDELGRSEERLARLDANAAGIRTRLNARRHVLADVLAALQRIGRRPPPALIVKPEDALGAIRSAIVFGAVLPEIRLEAEALASDLAALVAVRDEAAAELARLTADRETLAEARERVALLVEEKRKLEENSAATLATERMKAEDLAGEARSLEELIAALERDLDSARRAAEAARDRALAERPAIDDSGRISPAIAFASARGSLNLPVRGVEVQAFGDDTGLGGTAQGMSVATRAGARVAAPCDGWVVYAGEFRSYGRLLILNAGDGYHVVLAGMQTVDVELGQFVLTGEPIGEMGSQRLASAMAPDSNVSQPVLYIEFRKDGMSIDPSPWWVASEDRKVRG
ncbi:murein hydrolase activator EnvC family protein [Methylobrevis albus]|uniref:Peptidoglycan DD-metalloendopeptidase family protein n=1 Tax=Methylobrevis albus TaxID=2793297 RepID=A0A931I2F7_9HYPH|nr:peptidoglycan DD-metalloendopeptidase family protein [Methylobrevis albus]MBH0238068.1 peptidoglycan DD-metalloendopeptidase family protein [Methylobrevis albus]